MATELTIGRGTTPVYSIYFDGVDVSTISDIYITFKQPANPPQFAGIKLTKHFPDVYIDEELDVPKAVVRLTQSETLMFSSKYSGEAQVRFITNSGAAFKSDIFNVKVTDVLYEGVI